MVDNIISTPLIVTLILGVVGLAIPVIDAFKKERGSNNRLYSGIAFSALILTIGIVIFRILTGEVMPAVLFSKGVLSDDLFGSFFAVSLLIVSIMVTASSWNYMKGRINPAAYYSLILLSSIGMVHYPLLFWFLQLALSTALLEQPT
jgi:NADH-quinone oxidoreductase subunit N